MRVILDESEKKILRKLDKATRKKIGREIYKYQSGLPVNMKKIKTSLNDWRLAVDEWRVIMEYDHKSNTMRVTHIIQRKDAYR